MAALLVLGLALEALWLAVDGLAMCANETPGYATLMAQAAPWLDRFDQGILAMLVRLVPWVGAGDGGCSQASLAWTLGAAGVVFLAGVWLLDRTRIPSRCAAVSVLGFAALFAVTTLAMPALLSSDPVDYATHGRVFGIYGGNPYTEAPEAFAPDPMAGSGGWADVTTVYGPLWSRVEGLIASLEPSWDPVGQAAAFKAIGLASYLGSVGVVWWLTRRWAVLGLLRSSPSAAVAVFAWNPLVVFEEVGNAHNEGLMLLLLLLGLAPLTVALGTTDERREGAAWLLSIAILTLGALVKYVPALVGGLVVLAWLARARSARSRIRRAGAAAGVAIGLTVLVAWPWLSSTAILGPVLGIAAGGQRYAYAWQDAVATRIDVRILAHIGVPFAERQPLSRAITWGATRAVFVAWGAWEVWRLWRSARSENLTLARGIAGAACRLLLLAVLLVSTQVLPWYFLWAVAPGALLGWRSLTTKAAVLFGLAFLVAYYLREFVHYPTDQVPVYAEVTLCALAFVWLWGRVRQGVPLFTARRSAKPAAPTG